MYIGKAAKVVTMHNHADLFLVGVCNMEVEFPLQTVNV